VIFLFLGWAGFLQAQEDAAAPTAAPHAAFEIRTASAYLDYSYSSQPTAAVPAPTPFLSETTGGGSLQVAWTALRERTSATVVYTPSYIGHATYSSLNALNHTLSLTFSRKLAPRWAWNFSVAGDYSTRAQSIFSPTTLSNAAAVPATFDDLASAMLASKFTNPQLASVLTGATLNESPIRNLLYGERMFTSAVQTSLSYAYSPRLSISISGGANRSQHVSDNQASPNENAFLLQNTTSATAGFALSYSLSPRTHLKVTANGTRSSSAFFDAYTSTGLLSIGRTLGQRWFIQAHGGIGVINPLRQTAFLPSTTPLATGAQPTVGGGAGFKALANTFLASADRTAGDTYALGSSSTSSFTATWRWARPGSHWWFENSLSWQQLAGSNASHTSGWRSTTGLGRSINSHFTLLTQYAYSNYSSNALKDFAHDLSQDTLRVSITWQATPTPTSASK
jgi:hypothetical protein